MSDEEKEELVGTVDNSDDVAAPLEVKIIKEKEPEEENEEPDYEDMEITDKEIEDFRG